jgi:superfamily II RNA helicase
VQADRGQAVSHQRASSASSVPSKLTALDLTTAREKGTIRSIFARALSRLRARTGGLRLQELTRRGVGVHHGGLLPILNAVVDIDERRSTSFLVIWHRALHSLL